MPNPKIFCSVPWTNFHMYWDGSFGMCCYEKQKPYDETFSKQYNIKNMSVSQWFQSDVMKSKRIEILGDTELKECKGCYTEEKFGYESKRNKENLKTVIFNDRLEKSYSQSHWYDRFESAKNYSDQSPPIDWHVDLGNECNLACKMCNPNASSKIAAQYKKWNILNKSYPNWTNDPVSFKNFISSVDNLKIHRLHFMGGEPLINKKFREIIDHLIKTNRKELSVSFVSNGTEVDLELIEKLNFFRSFDIEISIESIKDNNHYIRQGCNTEKLKSNILQLQRIKTDNSNIILRTVPQLLSINTYHNLVLWAWENKLPIQGIPLKSPSYLAINILPEYLKTLFISNLEVALNTIRNSTSQQLKQLTTGRDVSRIDQLLTNECESLIKFLKEPAPADVTSQRKKLAEWLFKWDKVYNLNPFEIYPEYTEFLQKIEYGKV